MATVLSKDAADIEVPTARRFSRRGRGAQLPDAGEASEPRPSPGRRGRRGKVCLRGRSAPEPGAKQAGREVREARDRSVGPFG